VHADPARPGTVWIAEDVDREDSLLLTGRFSGYLERDEQLQERFEELKAEDAIAWGRARAATVLIRTGDSGCYFSAGDRNPNPRRFPDWSPAGVRLERRRPRGFEALDNTESDPPVLWDVRIETDLAQPLAVRAFHERIRTNPAAQDAQIPAPGYSAASAAFLVEASTREEADGLADRILKDALAALVKALPSGHVASWTCLAEVYPHRPGKPVRSSGVSY
jgi:hypothetical protein